MQLLELHALVIAHDGFDQSAPPRKWSWLPPVRWLGTYQAAWLPADVIAGVTLAAYAIPVSLAYASLAGLPPQVGIYGYLLGGLGYALLGSSRQLAVGPTSAISLMVAASVVQMAEGDAQRYVQIASLAAFTGGRALPARMAAPP
jgi:MFS superfamily sulfate permease-like transporter